MSLLSNLDYKEKTSVHTKLFSTGVLTSGSIEEKLELQKLICFLKQELSKKDPLKYTSCRVVIESILGTEIKNSTDGYHAFLDGLAVRCDDLLYGSHVENPGYKNSSDLIKRIKMILEEWLPF